MKKILVISDNDFLKMLYVMNMEVYLNIEVIPLRTVEEAIDELKIEPYDIVLTIEMINKEDAGKALRDHFKSYGIKTPLVICGNQKDEMFSPNVYGIAGKFAIQNILKCCAKILGITAKQMAELNVGAYYPISVEALLGLAKAPCNIYQNETGKNLLLKQDDSMEQVIANLAKDGIQQVYVNSGDRLLITNKTSLALIDKITASLKNMQEAPVEEKVTALSDGYEFAAANLFSSDEIKQQMQEIATASSKVMGDVARETSSLKGLLAIMINNRDGYIFTHSMITSYVAYHMIKNVTWGGESQVEKINFVLFFHDIFLGPIYLKYPQLRAEKDLLNSELLNDKDKDTVNNHAKLAAEVVVSYKRCPMGVDVLIKQHHGMKKGKGFAHTYMEDLSPLSKVILIAEMFVEEYMMAAENPAHPFDKKEVIPKIISNFKSASYTKIVQSLVSVPI